MSSISRRHFLEDSLLAAAAAAAATVVGGTPLAAKEANASSSPNEKLRGVVIGCNGRGNTHIEELIHRKNVELAFICDVDTKVGNRRCEEIAKALHGHKPKFAQDLRNVLDDKSVDFVTIATPNHWHSLAAIWAMQAGKDVYVEKPVSHNLSEGRRDVQAAERHKRICQAGMQSRSSPGLHEAVAYLRAGKLGEVKLARGLCYKSRGSIGPRGNYQPPKEVDYSLWSGPAQLLPVTRPHFHYDWHWQWPYGNGDIGNQGVHQMDIARWGLGIDTLANSVLSYGGRFGYQDAGDTPNTEVSILEFGPEKTLVFEVRGLKTDELLGAKVGVIFYGSEGYMVVPDYFSATVFDPQGKVVKTFKKGGDHFGNFLAAVGSRKPQDLNAPILDGHLSAALCHLGNTSYRLGSPHTEGEALEKLKSFKTNEHSKETLERVVSHLTANGVRLEGKTEFHLGPQLQFDPTTETFINNPEADTLLTRDYRAPFVVPTAANV
ncbi:MAG TPA: Gfo/Idh/MocA family oxidoreductase [Pirellulales bacterium]|jgi:predicted dehydrogenase|nr:Gfo/Idh/MocA family oxidoreductase [Pirellulales bacterium]